MKKKSIISGPFGSNISAKYFVNKGVPVIRGNNLSLDINKKFNDSGFVFITEDKANELGTWALKDDIVFTAVGTIGQVGILRGNENFNKYIISNKQLRLRVNKEMVEPLYAYYWFASPLIIDMILQRNTGSSVPLINLSVLKSLLIPLPPKIERIQILNIISSLDDKIDLLHRQNQTFEKMAETLFRQMMSEQDFSRLQDAQDENKLKSEKSCLSNNPENHVQDKEAKEDWEVGKLSDLVVVKYGKDHKKLLDGKIPVLGSGGVMRSEKVIDIFDAAGIKKPDISILSEEFLLEIKNMQHKNVALEVIKKLLNDEIRSMAKINLVQSKSLMKMLEDSIKRYQNKILTAAQVIEELINIGHEIKQMDKEPREMGLTQYEYAFYTAVASNKSAKELMQQDMLRELAIVLTERVRQNATIDWTIKESVRAKLKVIVKRTLRKYGYPPDMEKLATETVLKQAELLAEELMS